MSGEAIGLPPQAIWVLVLGFGAIIGSFLNVVIHRLPRIEGFWQEIKPLIPLFVINRHPIEVSDDTVVLPLPIRRTYTLSYPASHCTGCDKPIAWYDNIPVIAWLLLSGKCRNCKAAISIRYPLVEAATAILFAGLYSQYGLSVPFFGLCGLAAAMIVIFWIDVDFMMIPDSITLPMIWTGLLVHGLVTGAGTMAIEGAALGYLVFRGIELLALVLLKKEGMGRGDAKLAAMMGAWIGPKHLATALFLSFIIGSLAGIAVEVYRKQLNVAKALEAVWRHETQPFPFGPSLVLGGFSAMFAGDRLIAWYFGLMRG